MKTLHIDLETYSSVNLQKSGVYRYCEADDFEILLFAYSADGEEVQVVDLAQGEAIPPDVLSALTDESVIKWGFNANEKNILEKDEIRLWTPYNNFTLVDLNEGKNEIVIKLLKRTENLKFTVGFRQYDGNHWHRSKWCTDLT